MQLRREVGPHLSVLGDEWKVGVLVAEHDRIGWAGLDVLTEVKPRIVALGGGGLSGLNPQRFHGSAGAQPGSEPTQNSNSTAVSTAGGFVSVCHV